jgi:hypothetical protein
MPHSLSGRPRMGHVGPCIVRHRNAAERQQEREPDSAREATVGDVEVREAPQRPKRRARWRARARSAAQWSRALMSGSEASGRAVRARVNGTLMARGQRGR